MLFRPFVIPSFKKKLWEKYQHQYAYAKELEFDAVLEVIEDLLYTLSLK